MKKKYSAYDAIPHFTNEQVDIISSYNINPYVQLMLIDEFFANLEKYNISPEEVTDDVVNAFRKEISRYDEK